MRRCKCDAGDGQEWGTAVEQPPLYRSAQTCTRTAIVQELLLHPSSNMDHHPLPPVDPKQAACLALKRRAERRCAAAVVCSHAGMCTRTRTDRQHRQRSIHTLYARSTCICKLSVCRCHPLVLGGRPSTSCFFRSPQARHWTRTGTIFYKQMNTVYWNNRACDFQYNRRAHAIQNEFCLDRRPARLPTRAGRCSSCARPAGLVRELIPSSPVCCCCCAA